MRTILIAALIGSLANPTDAPSGLAAATAHWEAWSDSAGYRLDADEHGLVLTLTPAKGKTYRRDAKLVERGVEFFLELLPVPERTAADLAVPETSWGRGLFVPESAPVVLAHLAEPEDYDALLDHLAAEHTDLAGWFSDVRGEPGFANAVLLVGAWLDAPAGFELGKVWRSDHELVNRLARLLLMRGYGRQPHWLEQGLAWYVEQELLDALYAFPGRHEFVGVAEHDGWEPQLKSAFKDREDEPLTFEELAAWQRGTWDLEQAQLAWGFGRFLAEHHAEVLPALLEDLRLVTKANSIRTHDDGSWELVPDLELSAADQTRVFEQHLGADLLDEVGEFFREGRRYRPRK